MLGKGCPISLGRSWLETGCLNMQHDILISFGICVDHHLPTDSSIDLFTGNQYYLRTLLFINKLNLTSRCRFLILGLQNFLFSPGGKGKASTDASRVSFVHTHTYCDTMFCLLKNHNGWDFLKFTNLQLFLIKLKIKKHENKL